jgi:hydrogenase maturation protease
MRTLVIGLGNPILTDDGVGGYVARAVAEEIGNHPDIEVIELAVGGITLMEQMMGYERVLIIDALWSSANEVGQVVVFDAGYLPDTLNSASTHDADLPTALRVGRSLGADLPSDDQIQIVAITAHTVLDFGEEPTPLVKAAIPVATKTVLALLRQKSPVQTDTLLMKEG